MSKFEESRWTNSKFSQNYRDEANIYLPFRRVFIETAKSLYGYFFGPRTDTNVLDLGCGDGLFIEELLKTFSPKSITLVDGSQEMLDAAQKRLGKKGNIDFIQTSFQSLITNESLNPNYDFIYSALAIHHLPLEEKKRLYSYIYKLLSPGGCFVHYDVIVPVSTKIENCFLSLWRQWINEYPDKTINEKLLCIPDQYKKNTDNRPDTLDSQMQALTKIGFKDVDCYFKHGLFSLFGGFK